MNKITVEIIVYPDADIMHLVLNNDYKISAKHKGGGKLVMSGDFEDLRATDEEQASVIEEVAKAMIKLLE